MGELTLHDVHAAVTQHLVQLAAENSALSSQVTKLSDERAAAKARASSREAALTTGESQSLMDYVVAGADRSI